MPVTIVSKKTNADVISLTADVVANKAEYDARVVAVDATVADIQADHASHVANFEAEKVLRDAQKADLEAGIADARAEAGSAVADLDAKLDTEKASLQANIDALASSTSGDSGALTSRINELERKTGADLKDTVNSVLTEEVVKTTLDSFLAKDEELTSAVNNAVAERVNMDNDIKAKFDLLVSKLFEGLEISGVTQAELSFGPTSGRITLPDGTFVESVDDIDISQWQGRDGFAVADVVEVIRPGHNPDNDFDVIWITENDNDSYFETARYNPEGELQRNPYYFGSYTPGAVNTATYYGDGNHTTGYNTISRRA